MSCPQNGFGFLRRSPCGGGRENFRARRPRDSASSKKRTSGKRLTPCRRTRSHRAGGTVPQALIVETPATGCAQSQPARPPEFFVRGRSGAQIESYAARDLDGKADVWRVSTF